VNVAPSFVRTIFSTYATPVEYELAVRLFQDMVQTVPGATAFQEPVLQLGLGAESRIPAR